MCNKAPVRYFVGVSILQLTAGLWTPKAENTDFEVGGGDVAVARQYHWKSNSASLMDAYGLALDGQTDADWLVMLSHRNSTLADAVYLTMLLSTIFAMLFTGNKTANAAGQMQRPLFPKTLPALAALKYISILVFWQTHKWGQLTHCPLHTSRLLLMLSGFVLQFAEERRSLTDDRSSFSGYCSFITRRLTKLYPLFALSVIVAELMGYYRTTCRPISSLLVFPALVQESECATGQWFIPVIFACYMIFPFLSTAMRRASFPLTCVLVCLSALAVQVSYSSAISFERRSLIPSLPSFLLGMVLARLWTFLVIFDWYGRFCELVCPCSLVMLWLAHLRRGHLRRVAPTSFQSWITLWQCMLLLGYAGPCEQSKAALSNPLLKLLSWERLAWMGELALPLYMTNPMAVSFVRHLFADHGYHHLMIWQCWLAEFIFMHLMAYMFYTFCATTLASKAAARPPELRPAVSNAPQSLPAAANVSSSEQV
mmetsp:Transcript_14106/g.26863  ORF Transcript_14106/g.26863 Transcript_14106/m.26863 type:complete len:483 (-) Transcript_14106:72-1520(-)